jgi:hypothetical protein
MKSRLQNSHSVRTAIGYLANLRGYWQMSRMRGSRRHKMLFPLRRYNFDQPSD